MDEVTEVAYNVEFNRAETFDKFMLVIAQNDILNQFELVSGKNAVGFTLPRDVIRTFERMRKGFMIRNCSYHLDSITTTSFYK